MVTPQLAGIPATVELIGAATEVLAGGNGACREPVGPPLGNEEPQERMSYVFAAAQRSHQAQTSTP
jgi:hypothetical protein